MTTTDEASVAGRDLDAIVAETVMGWEVDRNHKFGLYANGTFVRNDETKVGFPPGYQPCTSCYEDGRVHRHYSHVPEYSTSIAAAWQVFEKLRADQLEISLSWDAGYDATLGRQMGVRGYRCLVSDAHDALFVLIEGCETAPLAICRAALKVSGGAHEVDSWLGHPSDLVRRTDEWLG